MSQQIHVDAALIGQIHQGVEVNHSLGQLAGDLVEEIAGCRNLGIGGIEFLGAEVKTAGIILNGFHERLAG